MIAALQNQNFTARGGCPPFFAKDRQRWLVEHERGWPASIEFGGELDKFAAASLRESHQREKIDRVYPMKIARNNCHRSM